MAVVGKQINKKSVIEYLDIALFHNDVGKLLCGLTSGGVSAAVNDTAAGMTALAGDHKLALGVCVKGNVERNKLCYVLGSLFHKHLDRLLVAKARARNESVLNVTLKRVVGGDDRGNTALGKI